MSACCLSAALGGIMCGGTTGHEGLPQGQSSGPDGAIALDDGGPGVDLDAGAFDVTINYADRVLPDVVTPHDTGAAGYPWPACPPFIPIGPSGQPVALGSEVNQIPAVLGQDGGEILAPDGSPCATYGWLGSTAVDDCLTSQASGFGVGDFALLPPCNWCAEAGVAAQGPGAGLPMYDLCLSLYACAMRTGCGAASSASACLCGNASATDCIADASGPCATEELAALQATTSAIQTALANFTQYDPQYPGFCGSSLNYVFQNARTNGCYRLLEAGADANQ